MFGPTLRAALLLLTLALASLPAPAEAQFTLSNSAEEAAPTLPDRLTKEQANELISRLSDTDVRAILLDQLETQAADEGEAEDQALSDFFYHATTGAAGAVTVPIERLPRLFEAQGEAFANFAERFGAYSLIRMLGLMAVAFAGALVIELIFRRFTKRWSTLPPPPTGPSEQSLRRTLTFLTLRLAHEFIAIGIFILAARAISDVLIDPELHPFVRLIGPYMVALPRVALAVSRFCMAPENPAYRLVHATDETARKTVFHTIWFAILIGFSGMIVQFNAMNGVPTGETRLGFWLNLAVHVYLIIILWRYREDFVRMMRGTDDPVSPMEDRIARAFPIFAIVVTAGIWWIINIVVSYGNFGLLAGAPHYKTMSLLLWAPAMDTAIRGLVRHLMPEMTGEGPVAERAHEAARKSYIRIGRVIVFGFVLLFIASFWGMSPQTIASAGVGPQLAAKFIEFLIILSVGYLVYEIVSLYINRKLAAEQTAAGFNPDEQEIGGDDGGAGGSRLSTVLPLILGVCRAAIVIVFALIALGTLGIDTTPLLAGAGILGLAIGFGAQKLVADVVSGIFFLIDDAFRTGEYVEVEGTMGTVETISIRSMQLRHHKGPVHTIPYGEIPKITNFSRDWVIMKLRFTVPFDSDPNKIKKIFKKIGQEMLALEEFKDDFLQPFKSQGVLQIDDVGMVIRGKFMCKPGTQFMIRKEIFNRVNAAFAEAGIDFARREVRVALPSMEQSHQLTEEDKAAISAAASQAAEAQAGAPPDPDQK